MTHQQKKLLDFIKAKLAETGISPSYEEMMAHMGARSKNSIHRLVACLVAHGAIHKLDRRARSICLADSATVPNTDRLWLLKIRGLASEVPTRNRRASTILAEILEASKAAMSA